MPELAHRHVSLRAPYPPGHEPVFIAGRWRKADHRCRSLAAGSPGLLARIDGGEAEADCYWCQAQEESQGEQCVRRIRPVGHHRVAKRVGGGNVQRNDRSAALNHGCRFQIGSNATPKHCKLEHPRDPSLNATVCFDALQFMMHNANHTSIQKKWESAKPCTERSCNRLVTLKNH